MGSGSYLTPRITAGKDVGTTTPIIRSRRDGNRLCRLRGTPRGKGLQGLRRDTETSTRQARKEPTAQNTGNTPFHHSLTPLHQPILLLILLILIRTLLTLLPLHQLVLLLLVLMFLLLLLLLLILLL